MPNLKLPAGQRLAQVLAGVITVAFWIYAAGRFARIGYEWARPRVAKALHTLAIALDGGLAYPDQPEPDSETELLCDFGTSMYRNGASASYDPPAAGTFHPMATGELIASSRPRARQRKSQAAEAAADALAGPLAPQLSL
jgi:hypothetical protein